MAAPDLLLETLLACETAVWQALVTGDGNADAAALSGDFLGLYPDGYSDKAAHVAQLDDGPTVATYALDDVRSRSLGPDHAVLCYQATFTRVGRSEAEAMWVSSIWRRDGNGWINIFSQDTPVSGWKPV